MSQSEEMGRVLKKYGYEVPPEEDPSKVMIFEPKHDCFAFVSLGSRDICSALKRMYCRYEQCHFYKTREEYENGKRSSKETT